MTETAEPTTALDVADQAKTRLEQAGTTQGTFAQMQELAKSVAKTEFVPVGLRNRPDAVLACILTGKELGIEPMQALRQIYVTDDGKVGLEAELMLAKMREAGIEILESDVNEERATITARRPGGEVMTVDFTLAEAERAGLLSKHNWKKYPKDMMWARVVSRLYRRFAPDTAMGASHTPEELGVIDADVIFKPPVEDLAEAADVERLTLALAVGAETSDHWRLDAVIATAKKTYRPDIEKLEDLSKAEFNGVANALKKAGVDWQDEQFAPAAEVVEEADEPAAAT